MQSDRPLSQRIMHEWSRLADVKLVTAGAHAIRQEGNNHLYVWVNPDSGSGDAEMPKACHTEAIAGQRALFALSIESSAQRAARPLPHEPCDIDGGASSARRAMRAGRANRAKWLPDAIHR